MGRGARFQRSIHPAAILIFLPSNAPEVATSRAPQLQSFLKKAGHKARVVQGVDRLSEAISSSQYDLILADLAEVAEVQKQIDAASSKPSIVPVAIRSSKPEVSAARKQYGCLIKHANNGDEYLDAIYDAMKQRMRLVQKKT
jgi:DNA-binding NtrC family response regulator